MDIYTYQLRFDHEAQPAAPYSSTQLEKAWKNLQQALRAGLDEEYCEEFSFSVGFGSVYVGSKARENPDLFQVYFGRLIDAGPGCRWRTAEINYYFQYTMSQDLRALLAQLDDCNIEEAYCKSAGQKVIQDKLNTWIAHVDQKETLWAILRTLTPIQFDLQFYLS